MKGGKYNFGRILPTDIGPTRGQNAISGMAAAVPAFMQSYYQAQDFANQQAQQKIKNKQMEDQLRIRRDDQDLQRQGYGLQERGQNIRVAGMLQTQAEQDRAQQRWMGTREDQQKYREHQAAAEEQKRLLSGLHPSVYQYVQGNTAVEQNNFIRDNYAVLSAESARALQDERNQEVKFAGRKAGAGAAARNAANLSSKKKEADMRAAGFAQYMTESDPNFTGPPAAPGKDVIPYTPSAGANPLVQGLLTRAKLTEAEYFKELEDARRMGHETTRGLDQSGGGYYVSPVAWGTKSKELEIRLGRPPLDIEVLEELGKQVTPQALYQIAKQKAAEGSRDAAEWIQLYDASRSQQ